jgi:hypothetical protein
MAILRMKYLFESFVTMNKDEIVDLLEYIESIDLLPLKYGFSSYRPKYEYNSERKMDVADLCYKEGSTSIKGKEFLIEFGVSETYAKPYLHTFKIKTSSKVNPQRLVDIGVKLCSILKACYGFAHLSNDYDWGTPGRSIEDCIFGFSWLNIFGKPYIDLWQKERILKAPAIISTCDDFVIIMLSQTPFTEIEELRKKNDELKTYFGFKYFYNKRFENQKTSFKSVQEISEYHKMLDEKADYLAPDFHKYYDYHSNNKSLFAVQKGVMHLSDVETLKENKNITIEEI